MAASLIALAGVAAVSTAAADHGEPGYSLVQCIQELVPGTNQCGDSTLQEEEHDCQLLLTSPGTPEWFAECVNPAP